MLLKASPNILVAAKMLHASQSTLHELIVEKVAEPKEIMIPIPYGHIAGKSGRK